MSLLWSEASDPGAQSQDKYGPVAGAGLLLCQGSICQPCDESAPWSAVDPQGAELAVSADWPHIHSSTFHTTWLPDSLALEELPARGRAGIPGYFAQLESLVLVRAGYRTSRGALNHREDPVGHDGCSATHTPG